MRIPGEDICSDFNHHVVAAIVRRRLRRHKDEGRLIGHAAVDGDHGSIGDREHVLAEAIKLLDRLAVSVEESVALDLAPINGEGFGGLNAGPIDRDAFVSMDIGLAAAAGDEPAIPRKRRSNDNGWLAVDHHLWTIDLRAINHSLVLASPARVCKRSDASHALGLSPAGGSATTNGDRNRRGTTGRRRPSSGRQPTLPNFFAPRSRCRTA